MLVLLFIYIFLTLYIDVTFIFCLYFFWAKQCHLYLKKKSIYVNCHNNTIIAERFNKKFSENTFLLSEIDNLDYSIVQIFY